ncbi:homocysteine S-methyltransferase family protein [Novosphingobium sp.]|uniref:homocysteine S-methyltransferase family protein n=1 Tax=Novosphingobium sp. TaxID=1874826 RepID=UPI00333E9FCE
MTHPAAARITLLDGGTGRELKRIGAPFKQPEWSALALIEGPEFVARVHQSYVDAGADVITTNTYAVVPFHIGEERFAAQGHDLAALAGSLARGVADSAPRQVAVAGSLPPVCGSYRPDLVDIDRARPILAVLVAALAPHVDHWLAETLSSLSEAELVAELTAPSGKPLWLSFTLDDTHPGAIARLRSGESVTDAALLAQKLGAQAVLFNCSQPEVMADAVHAARAATGLRIGVYANAFPPQPEEATANAVLLDIRADLDPAGYGAFAQSWRDAGATILGGCCGIGPEHIAALHTLNG